jgi:glycosyltransferase involved in cell wall biosynthesis
MSRVLLVAPVATHPSSTGASSRIRHMAEALRHRGRQVDFLYLQQPLRVDASAMRRYWQDRLHVFRSLSPASLVGRARRKLYRIVGKTFHLNLPVDCYFDPEAARFLEKIVASHGFDAVIVSYVFYSRLLESLSGPRTLIDTHDVFADRFRLYRQHGQANEFFSTSPAEEGKALARADAILAIQDSDANHFRSLTSRPVAIVGHLARPADTRPTPPPESSVLLFVGGPMGINVHGVTWFLENVWPSVRSQVPQTELWLVGGIGDRVGSGAPAVRQLGFVDRLDQVYEGATVVINPQQFGTGLSIKSVDALLHGRPLVTTDSGARGLEAGAGAAFHQASSAEEFSQLVVALLRDPARAADLSRCAFDFALAYYRRNLQALDDVLSGSVSR